MEQAGVIYACCGDHDATIPTGAAFAILTELTIGGCAHDGAPMANMPSPAPGTGVPGGIANTQNAADLENCRSFGDSAMPSRAGLQHLVECKTEALCLK